MPVSCSTMKKGDVYTCKNCGIEIKVTKACSDESEMGECGCGEIEFSCCGEPLQKKSAGK